MKIERTQNSIKSTAFGILNRCINLLIPFAIRTVMIRTLGSEFLGLNSLFTSIIQVLNLTELGIGSALVYSMYKPIAEDDYDTLSGLLNVYKKIYRVIGLVIMGLGLALLPVLPWLVNTEELEGTGINLYILFLIYLLNTVISYWFFAFRKSLLTAYQRQDVISNINSIIHLVLYSAQLLVLFLVPNYYIYIILMPVFTVLDNICVGIVTSRKYAHIIRNANKKKIVAKHLFSNTKYVVGHKIGGVILQSGDSIVISAFLNLSLLTIYSNYFYIISALVGLINVGYNAILAGVGNSIITKTKEQLYELFEDLSFLIFYIVSFCTGALLCLYQPFIELWMGADFLLPLSSVILFAVYFYTWQVRVIALNFKDAAGMWKNDWLKPYIGMVVNVGLNILLVQFWGVNGVLIATIALMGLVYFPWETYVLHKDLFNRSAKKYLLKNLYYVLVTVFCSALTYFAISLITRGGISGFILKVLVTCVCLNVLLCILCFRLPECKHMIARVKRLLKRKTT